MKQSSNDTSNRNIKVLHLITSLEVGGAQHGLLLGLPRFNTDRYEHIICSLMNRIPMADQFRESGIEVHSLGLNRRTDLSVLVRLRKLMKKVRPDVLHTYLLHANVLGRIVGRLVGIPVIIGSERTIGQVGPCGRLATKLSNPLTNAVEVNSELGARSIAIDLGVPPNKIEVVRSGVDLKKFGHSTNRAAIRSQIGLKKDQHLVLYIGRLRAVKGIEYGLRAFAAAQSQLSSMHMALAGEGELLGHLKNIVRELNVSDHVTFLGVRNDLPDLLSAADSVLMPSLNEGFPRTAIEAMAAGKPIIATNVGGTSEAIIDGETGILIPAKDIEVMTSTLLRLVNDKDLQLKLGEAGRQRSRNNYSVNNYVTRLDELYRKLLKYDDPSTQDPIKLN
jgi:glycosyltransferase involved in cell wall biosynthesis